MFAEAGSGVVMLLAAVAALLWANLDWFGDSYTTFWKETYLTLEVGSFELKESLQHLVNDGLMVIFFFVVGLEIKRELVLGDLRDPKAAALPVMGALGGMALPILVFVVVVMGEGGEALRGWGVPVATDIAFTIGVLSLLGRRVPAPAKIFLLALAIVDDIGGILIIAIFYTDDLSFAWLAVGLVLLGIMYGANRAGVRSFVFYVPTALVIWLCFLESGVHATIAGVAIAFLTPALPMYSGVEYDTKARSILNMYPTHITTHEEREKVDFEAMTLSSIARESVSPLYRAEHGLQLWSSFLVVPLFALANAGVKFDSDFLGDLFSPVSLGVALGLLIGKSVGVPFFAWLAVVTRIAHLPHNTSWRHLIGVSATAGIGFTVALFISSLAFEGNSLLGNQATMGIFLGSLLAGVLGVGILFWAKPVHHPSLLPDAE